MESVLVCPVCWERAPKHVIDESSVVAMCGDWSTGPSRSTWLHESCGKVAVSVSLLDYQTLRRPTPYRTTFEHSFKVGDEVWCFLPYFARLRKVNVCDVHVRFSVEGSTFVNYHSPYENHKSEDTYRSPREYVRMNPREGGWTLEALVALGLTHEQASEAMK